MNIFGRQPYFQSRFLKRNRRVYSTQCSAKEYMYSPMEACFVVGSIIGFLINKNMTDQFRSLNGRIRDIAGKQRKIHDDLRVFELRQLAILDELKRLQEDKNISNSISNEHGTHGSPKIEGAREP